MRLIEIPSDEIIRIPIMDGDIKVGQRCVDLSDMPTIDAVPVVRCKDCKHSRELNKYEKKYIVEGILICTSSDAHEDAWNPMWPHDFCSYGERKDGAGNG